MPSKLDEIRRRAEEATESAARAVSAALDMFVVCENGMSLFVDVTWRHLGEGERFGVGVLLLAQQRGDQFISSELFVLAALVQRAVARWDQKEPTPYVMYFHTWEFDPDQPRVNGVPLHQQIRQYRNLRRMPSMVRH